MKLVEIRRLPVKSLCGEAMQTAEVGERGLPGDWLDSRRRYVLLGVRW
jgi:uncharacterized protein YcbX